MGDYVTLTYKFELTELNTYFVKCLNWDLVFTEGDDIEEAKKMAIDATELAFERFNEGALVDEQKPDFGSQHRLTKNRFQLTFDSVTGKHIPTKKAEA